MDVKSKIAEVENLNVEKIVVHRYGRCFQVYPWIKSRIFHKVLMGSEVIQEKSRAIFWQQLKSLPYGFFSFFRRYDAWAFSYYGERIKIDNVQIDKLVDPLSSRNKLKMLVIEMQLTGKSKRKDVASKYIVSKAIFVFLEELYAKLFLRRVYFEGKEELLQLEAALDSQISVENIVRKYLAQYRVMKFFLKILPKPKVVFLTVSYANFGAIRAFKEAGIKVVELQHGLIGDGHYGYTYHKKFDDVQFPDEILVFGDSDKDFFFEATKIPIKRAVAVGRFVMDHFQKTALPNVVPIQHILVSLQDSDLSYALLDFVLEVNQIDPGKFNWIIQPRRTPEGVYRERYEFPENITFSKTSVYNAIGLADAHLTIYSTTAIESMSIGKPTFLFNYKNMANTYLGQFLGSNPNTYFCDSVHDFMRLSEKLELKSLNEIAESNSANVCADYNGKIAAYIDELVYEVAKK